jgi:hypothetical protein
MELIGLLTFLALIALTSYAVHVARAEESGTRLIGPQPRRRHGHSGTGFGHRH